MSDPASPEACQQALPAVTTSVPDAATTTLATVVSETAPADPSIHPAIEDVISVSDADTNILTALPPAPSTASASVPIVATEEALSPISASADNAPAATTDAAPAKVEAASRTSSAAGPVLPPLQPHNGQPEATIQPGSGKHASASTSETLCLKSAMHENPTKLKAGAKGKEVAAARKPLTLLELPVDILQLIIKKIVRLNGLSALALTCSTLYSLCVPFLYASYDIIWLDSQEGESEGRGVDALTYGLSTLCLGSAFARATHQLRASLRRRGPARATHQNRGVKGAVKSNDYAKYVRKFSLGNGARDDIFGYHIRRERGKMLGTLVALAVAKMHNLENFVWDMPTGILSDVFMALGSLPDSHPETGECKLERMWVRCHNSRTMIDKTAPNSRSSTPEPPQNFVVQGSTLTSMGILLPSHSAHPEPRETITYSQSQVEFPTFSVVPPLKSLAVLDIDDISCLDELSILIEKSHTRLDELRIGIAQHAINDDFAQSWDGPDLKQVDLDAYWPGESTIGDRRLGGVMGILVGRICDIRHQTESASTMSTTNEEVAAKTSHPAEVSEASGEDATTSRAAVDAAHTDAESNTGPSASTDATPNGSTTNGCSESGDAPLTPSVSTDMEHSDEDVLDTRLKLLTLELERVPLSMVTMVRTLDWSTITSLTILSCPHADGLWRQLRKQFRPTPATTSTSSAVTPSRRAMRAWGTRPPPMHYHLALKSVHTDNVRRPLLSFIKETLQPHSLEVLFLHHRHDSHGTPPPITDVFDSAVRPHCSSLRKLLLNGDLRRHVHGDNFSRRARHWDLPRWQVRYLASGRMRELRELSFSVHYTNWHIFLQMLPNLPHLTSLHIQNISRHVNGEYSRSESAMQIADIVALQPHMKMAYIGIAPKCFEVIEVIKAADGSDLRNAAGRSRRGSNVYSSSSSDSSSDSDDNHSDSHDDSQSDFDSDDGSAHGSGNAVFDDSGDSDYIGDESDEGGSRVLATLRAPRMRLREIFFYDDLAIFKAYHGRL